MDIKQLRNLLDAEQALISKIALGAPLIDCLTKTCLYIESILNDPSARASILLLKGKQLHHGAAPSLDEKYCELIDGVEIGPSVGSCGTAAFLKKQTIVADIAADPLWEDCKTFALDAGLKACWSTPIMSSSHQVLGSFAIYYTKPYHPKAHHLELINKFTHLSGLAIEKSLHQEKERELTNQLKHSNEKLRTFTNVMPDLCLILTEDGTYTDIYGADTDLIYKGSRDIVGKNVSDILPAQDAQAVLKVIQKAIHNESLEVFEYTLDVPKGRIVFEGRVARIEHYDSSKPSQNHVLWLARDITERKKAEQQIENLAYYDPLTGLANRRLLNEHLKSAVETAQENDSKSVLIYMDLDDFKRINDSLGHSVGDLLLVNAAQRLKPILKSSDVIARIGGDEFVILQHGSSAETDKVINDASSLAKQIISLFKDSFSIAGSEYRIGVSIGISIVNTLSQSVDEVLKRADTAMYRSKKLGGNRFTFFDPVLQRALDEKLTIEQGLLQGLNDGQFDTFFQPQVCTKGEIVGAEALVRWKHPQNGFIPPLTFIPIAEQIGLINSIQSFVLRKSCLLHAQLLKEGLINEEFTISINISPCQFKSLTLKEELLNTLREFDVQPNKIKLEITESMLIDNVDATVSQMEELRKLGFRFSVDDFGTGYSSLTYLHTFPIDDLKIDKSFIDRIHDHEAGIGIVDAIISLSNHLNFDVIAEGVEDEEQKNILVQRRIKAMQGYLFSKPVPSADFIEIMRSSAPRIMTSMF